MDVCDEKSVIGVLLECYYKWREEKKRNNQ
jgi:hypothetical protein